MTDRIPQGGRRRPPSKHKPTLGTTLQQRIERRQDGTYRIWWTRDNRCCNPMQVGSALIGVMDDFGSFVTLREEMPWH